MTGKGIAHHMQIFFAEYRWPATLITDNGPYYTSKEFQMLMKSIYVSYITSSLHYPQSNGLAEKFVGIIKKSIPQSQRGRPGTLLSPNGLQKHTPQWMFAVTHANCTR